LDVKEHEKKAFEDKTLHLTLKERNKKGEKSTEIGKSQLKITSKHLEGIHNEEVSFGDGNPTFKLTVQSVVSKSEDKSVDEPEEKQETKDKDKDKDKEKDNDKKIKHKKLLGSPNESSEISEVGSVDASEEGDSKKGTPSKKKSSFNGTNSQ